MGVVMQSSSARAILSTLGVAVSASSLGLISGLLLFLGVASY
jgi:hypothetical protein